MTYDFSISLKGTLTRTVAPGVRGTPAKLKPAGNALAENASHARAQKIFATLGRRFLDAQVTDDYDNPGWKKFKGGLWRREQGRG